MKKEDKELLLKDLCARLPYKVIVEIKSYTQETSRPWFGELSCKDLDCFIHDVAYESIKPYLRPMSSMTEEEEEEYEDVIRGSFEQQLEFYLRRHLDFRGLISKGLALEAPKNMYNEIEEE